MFVPSVTWNFCHALICSPTNIQAVGNQNARMDSFLDPDAIDVSLNVGIPTVFAANLFFSKKISSRKKKKATHKKNPPAFFFMDYFLVPLRFPWFQKFPVGSHFRQMISNQHCPCPPGRLQGMRQLCPDALLEKLPVLAVVLFFLGAAGWSQWWLSTGNSPKMALIALWTKGEGLNSG